MCMRVCVCLYVRVYVYLYVYMCVCIHFIFMSCVCVCIYIYTRAGELCIYICMYICEHVCVYVTSISAFACISCLSVCYRYILFGGSCPLFGGALVIVPICFFWVGASP